MLTFERPPIVDQDTCKIGIWNDETKQYEVHSFEFIENLWELITQPAFVSDRNDQLSARI